jgi:hypothetical protein
MPDNRPLPAYARLEAASATINLAKAIRCIAISANLPYGCEPDQLRRVMSRQLAISATFSVLAMAAYVLFSGNAIRTPLDDTSPASGNRVEISASEYVSADKLLLQLVR